MAHQEILLNDFAIRCFRETADQDYIAARMTFRAGIYQQFHWSALQSIEKYLKCILLLNRIKARDVNHDLGRALAHAKKLPFRLALRQSTTELINHLDTFGRFRYLESSYHIHGPKLVHLDRAVWEIRRYCRVLNYTIRVSDGTTKDMMPLEIKEIESSQTAPVRPFRLGGGFLEKVVDAPDHPARPALIWQNLYFGSRLRKKVRMPITFHATNSPLSLHPEVLDPVLQYVFLPREVIDAFREHAGRERRPA